MKLDDRFKPRLVTWSVLYPFEVFVEEEEHVGMVALLPGLEQVREVGRAPDLVLEEVVGEGVQIALVAVEVHDAVVVVVGHDDVLGIARHVHHLRASEFVRQAPWTPSTATKKSAPSRLGSRLELRKESAVYRNGKSSDEKQLEAVFFWLEDNSPPIKSKRDRRADRKCFQERRIKKKKKRKKEKEERKGGRGHFGLFQDVRIEEVEGQVRLDDARPAQVFDVAGRRHLLADQQVDEATHRRLDQVPDAVVFQRLQHRRGERHAHPPIFFKFFFLVFNFIFFGSSTVQNQRPTVGVFLLFFSRVWGRTTPLITPADDPPP